MPARNPLVLVVDDEENIRYLVESGLQLAGFQTISAGDGRAALAAVTESQPNLVVLDVNMPDIDGFETLRRLRQSGVQTPVIFLTARDSTDDRVRGLTEGGDDYLVKPFAIAELVARVQLRIGQAAETSTILRCADLELDPDAHRVSRAGTAIDLSPTEYRLLQVLLENVGRVLSRSQILQQVWEYDFDGDSSVVDTYISYLRRKVDTSEPKLIHTVRGVGFCLRLDQ